MDRPLMISPMVDITGHNYLDKFKRNDAILSGMMPFFEQLFTGIDRVLTVFANLSIMFGLCYFTICFKYVL